MIFIFLPCNEKAHHDNKEFIWEIQNLVNVESQPVKSNPLDLNS